MLCTARRGRVILLHSFTSSLHSAFLSSIIYIQLCSTHFFRYMAHFHHSNSIRYSSLSLFKDVLASNVGQLTNHLSKKSVVDVKKMSVDRDFFSLIFFFLVGLHFLSFFFKIPWIRGSISNGRRPLLELSHSIIWMKSKRMLFFFKASILVSSFIGRSVRNAIHFRA